MERLLSILLSQILNSSIQEHIYSRCHKLYNNDWLHYWLTSHLGHDYNKEELTIEENHIHRTNTSWKQHSFVAFLENYNDKKKKKNKIKVLVFNILCDSYAMTLNLGSGNIINQKRNKCCPKLIKKTSCVIIPISLSPNLKDLLSQTQQIPELIQACIMLNNGDHGLPCQPS